MTLNHACKSLIDKNVPNGKNDGERMEFSNYLKKISLIAKKTHKNESKQFEIEQYFKIEIKIMI